MATQFFGTNLDTLQQAILADAALKADRENQYRNYLSTLSGQRQQGQSTRQLADTQAAYNNAILNSQNMDRTQRAEVERERLAETALERAARERIADAQIKSQDQRAAIAALGQVVGGQNRYGGDPAGVQGIRANAEVKAAQFNEAAALMAKRRNRELMQKSQENANKSFSWARQDPLEAAMKEIRATLTPEDLEFVDIENGRFVPVTRTVPQIGRGYEQPQSDYTQQLLQYLVSQAFPQAAQATQPAPAPQVDQGMMVPQPTQAPEQQLNPALLLQMPGLGNGIFGGTPSVATPGINQNSGNTNAWQNIGGSRVRLVR